MRETGDPGCDNGSVPPTPAQQARAEAIAAEITARLAGLPFALPGTAADRTTRCGYPGCRCHAAPPQRHGPYHQWTRRKNGKTATRILTDGQLADYAPWCWTSLRIPMMSGCSGAEDADVVVQLDLGGGVFVGGGTVPM